MTPEEKNALLQFMGMTYGHSHKLDTHIVGNSQFVKPISTTVKEVFEQVLKSDTTNKPSFLQEHPTQPESSVINEAPVRDLAPITKSTQYSASQPAPQISETVNYLEKISLELQRIGDIIETIIKENNVKSRKKTKNTI